MKREILFRGKTKLNNKLIFGMPTYDFEYIFNNESVDSVDNFEVIPETVGQFTGLTDKNEVKIFEGDIVILNGLSMNGYIDVIENKIDFFAPSYSSQPASILIEIGISIEVIGNIHDNPELLQS